MKDIGTILTAILLAGFAFGLVAFMTVLGTFLAPMIAVIGVVFLIYAVLREEDD